jgi:Spy/CpxP family protein refolding chaperone
MKYTIIALLVLFVSFASAQQGMRGKAHGRAGGGDGGVVHKLKLTDDQQKQFDKLSSDLEKTQIALRSKIQTANVELHDLMKEDSPDRAKFLAKQAEINKLEGELKQNRTGFWFDVNKILTPEQQKDWKKHLKMQMSERPGFGMGRIMGWLHQHGFGGRPQQQDGPEN